MRVFVTGTDTGVGKTVVSTIWALAMGAHYWKPIQTGLAQDGLDSDFAALYIGHERVIPEVYTFETGLSPDAAARIENTKINMRQILDTARNLPPRTVIEGAGGVLVPISSEEKMVDLMQALEAPALVVCRTSVGTLNHTMLTVEALRARRIPIVGLVAVGTPHPSNLEDLPAVTGYPLLAHVDLCSKFSQDWFLNQAANLKTKFNQMFNGDLHEA